MVSVSALSPASGMVVDFPLDGMALLERLDFVFEDVLCATGDADLSLRVF